MRCLLVFGTRPEAIKMAPLFNALRKRSGISVGVAVTAQHREMLDQVLELFDIVPDYDLNLMRHGQTLADITGRVVSGIQEVIAADHPDLVLVQGDTTTTFAAALAAFYERTAVGHVEAGLRSGSKYAPFPEEINRRLTTVLADFHFAPTPVSRANLLREGVEAGRIFVTGNTVIDALLHTAKEDYAFSDPVLAALDLKRRIVLVTAHRRENWGAPMREMFAALAELSEAFPEVEIVFPVHKNPALQELSRSLLGGKENVRLVQPLDYEPFVNLMARSSLVLTDSGGLQEEAPALGKPVLVLRDTTERPEGVEAGTVQLVGTSCDDIVRETSLLLSDADAYERMAAAVNPYGDGSASERIVDWLLHRFGLADNFPQEFSPANSCALGGKK